MTTAAESTPILPTTTVAAPASRWWSGVHPFALAAFVLSLVSLVMAIIIRATDLEVDGFWSGFFVNLEGGLRDVVWQLAVLVLIVLVFAFIRRPDPAVDRFAGIAGRGLWLTIAALLIACIAGPINHRDEGLGTMFSDAIAEGMSAGATDDDTSYDEDYDEDLDDDYDDEDLDY
jgi:hypothetical protein